MAENPTTKKNVINVPEKDGIDFLALAKSLWKGRKTIIICTAVFIVLGFVAAFTMKRTYTVTTTMVPQMSSSRSSSSLSSLASLAGLDLGMTSSGADLSPLVYPQIVSSVPFRLQLLYTPLHYEKVDTAITMFNYYKDYNKPGIGSYIRKYTIGLPFVILGLFQKDDAEEEESTPVNANEADDDGTPKPIVLTKDEEAMIKAIGASINLTLEKKEGYLTLSVTGSEPLQTAELAVAAQVLLQSEVTRFRTEKAQNQLKYIEARFQEIKAENENYQTQLATVRDRSKNMPSSRALIEQERILAKYTVSSAIYSEMAKQLEQAKMQVKRDTPTLTVIKPVTVPRQASNSRASTLIFWTFMGLVLGCGIVLGKEYYPKVKEMLKAA